MGSVLMSIAAAVVVAVGLVFVRRMWGRGGDDATGGGWGDVDGDGGDGGGD